MNKEVKAIVEYLEEEREAIRTKCYYPDDVLNCEDLIMLMDYINQLETNRDEAIELLKEHLNSVNYEFEEYKWFGREYLEELLFLLERGKE